MFKFNRIIEKSISFRAENGLDKVDRLYHRELTGVPAVYGIDPWNQDTSQQNELGAVGFDRFGYKYRYVRNSTVLLVTGNLIQTAVQPSNFVDLAVGIAAPLITTGTSPTPNKTVSLTLNGTAVTANQFANGIAVVSVTPGLGNMYTILTHDVQASTSGACKFNFQEVLLTALTTSSKMTLMPYPYNQVVANPTTPTGYSAGICIYPLKAQVTSPQTDYYGWVGNTGVFGALSDSVAAAVGNGISPSTTTSGCITKAVTLKDSIGYHITAAASAQVEPQWFNIG